MTDNPTHKKLVEVSDMLEMRAGRKTEDWWDKDSAWIVYDAVTSACRLRAMRPDDERFKVTAEDIPEEAVEAAADAAFEDYFTAFKLYNPDYESVVN
jgi:hypothetical protein